MRTTCEYRVDKPMNKTAAWIRCAVGCLAVAYASVSFAAGSDATTSTTTFYGQHYAGQGDVEYLRLLDISARMLHPDPEFQNLSMLYMPSWNGFVEGPTWDAWWIQNSYGTTYSVLPFLREPYITFLQNAQDLWFDNMGDGKRVGEHGWVAPDGCLCDCARPGWVMFRQGDGRIDIHDWALEFTAAGVLLQAELLLISRDQERIRHYLPLLDRCVSFIETRRDPKTNLFLAGPAANLLAPSYAGAPKPDGTFDKAYLTGLSITHIAALHRLKEVAVLADDLGKAERYSTLASSATRGLEKLKTAEGYFIRSLDLDGTKHGMFGASKHGYFESSPNHDAIAFGVVDLDGARKIMAKIDSIPGLRPYGVIIPNYPSYDDMYTAPEGLWSFGTWVNGGHWSTCEARMVLAYLKLDRFADARRSVEHMLGFARRFRMDNPLTKFGSDVYQPKEAINLCYDSFGPMTAFLRGLFGYTYSAKSLILYPHIPPSITELHQLDPVQWGSKLIYINVVGSGPIEDATVNGRSIPWSGDSSTRLKYDETPDVAHLYIFRRDKPKQRIGPGPENQDVTTSSIHPEAQRALRFAQKLRASDLGDTYEAAHAQLIADAFRARDERLDLLRTGKLAPLPEPTATAANDSYTTAALKLYEGLTKQMDQPTSSSEKARIQQIWRETK